VATVSRQELSRPDAQEPRLGRTFAMTIVSAGSWAVAAGLAYLLAQLVPTLATEPENAPVLVVLVLFTLLFGITGAVALTWSGARRRAWYWLVPVVPAVLLLLLNARRLPYDISHPANPGSFLVAIMVVAGVSGLVIGGIAAFLEVRRGRAIWSGSGRAGWAFTAVTGVVLGAALTSLLAGAVASSTTAGVAATPTTTDVLTVENTKFVETHLEMSDGETLGLFIVNKDPFAHSFDIDSVGLHIELPPNSTTAVVIEPTGPGEIEFFCGVPGHKAAGMVGTLDVK